MRGRFFTKRREVTKRAKNTQKLVLLLKAILVSTPIFVLFYDGWSTFQPLPKLTLTGYATVIDGDTLKVGGQVVRLSGIDALEREQTCRLSSGRLYLCGEEASEALGRLVRFSKVVCEQWGSRDRYGRVVARCSVGSWLTGQRVDLSAALVSSGHALVYRQFAGKQLAELVQLEREARLRTVGAWQGTFEVPEKWRSKKQNK